MIAVAAAHWPNVAGWLYRNTVGNLAASALWVPPASVGGFLVGKAREKRAEARHVEALDAHAATAAQLDELHRFHGIGRHAAG